MYQAGTKCSLRSQRILRHHCSGLRGTNSTTLYQTPHYMSPSDKRCTLLVLSYLEFEKPLKTCRSDRAQICTTLDPVFPGTLYRTNTFHIRHARCLCLRSALSCLQGKENSLVSSVLSRCHSTRLHSCCTVMRRRAPSPKNTCQQDSRHSLPSCSGPSTRENDMYLSNTHLPYKSTDLECPGTFPVRMQCNRLHFPCRWKGSHTPPDTLCTQWSH